MTVIPAELHAVQRALKIDPRKNRVYVDGGIFFPAAVYSAVMNRDVSVILGCIGEASQANAAAMAMLMIKEFDPAMIVLVGIAAGLRGKLKIGDVVVPREVADLSVSVAVPGRKRARPQVKPRTYTVRQMIAGFVLDEPTFFDQCRETFGPPSIPVGKEKEFAEHVTFKPAVADSTIASADVLLKDPDAFLDLMDTHEAIRSAEMEAGGFVKACETGIHTRPWLVVRGVSDFGDNFKDDCFHRLAASAAAVWTLFFLRDGLDFGSAQSGTTVSVSPAAPAPTAPIVAKASIATAPAVLGPATADFITAQFEKIAQVASDDRQKDLEGIKEAWKGGRDRNALQRVREMRSRPDWDAVSPMVKAKCLRFESSLVLAIEDNVAQAKALATEAEKLDPDGKSEKLEALIAYHRGRSAAALPMLENPTTLDGWNFRLALLGDAQRWEEVLAETERPPVNIVPDADSRRLRTLALVFSGRLKDAREEINHALSEQPEWFSVRYAAAIVDYYESLSPAMVPHAPKGWPGPIDMAYVRRDQAAVAALRRAEGVFAKLLEAGGLNEITRRILEGWRLASLANDIERQDAATRYCSELVKAHPQHPVAHSWALARGYSIDASTSIDALFTEIFS